MLVEYFSGFVHATHRSEASPEVADGADVEFTRAKYFIRDNFLQICLQIFSAFAASARPLLSLTDGRVTGRPLLFDQQQYKNH